MFKHLINTAMPEHLEVRLMHGLWRHPSTTAGIHNPCMAPRHLCSRCRVARTTTRGEEMSRRLEKDMKDWRLMFPCREHDNTETYGEMDQSEGNGTAESVKHEYQA